MIVPYCQSTICTRALVRFIWRNSTLSYSRRVSEGTLRFRSLAQGPEAETLRGMEQPAEEVLNLTRRRRALFA